MPITGPTAGRRRRCSPSDGPAPQRHQPSRRRHGLGAFNTDSAPRTYVLAVGGVDAKLAIVGIQNGSSIVVAPETSEALRVTLTGSADGQGEVVFTARDETGATVLTAKDRFVDR